MVRPRLLRYDDDNLTFTLAGAQSMNRVIEGSASASVVLRVHDGVKVQNEYTHMIPIEILIEDYKELVQLPGTAQYGCCSVIL